MTIGLFVNSKTRLQHSVLSQEAQSQEGVMVLVGAWGRGLGGRGGPSGLQGKWMWETRGLKDLILRRTNDFHRMRTHSTREKRLICQQQNNIESLCKRICLGSSAYNIIRTSGRKLEI